MAEENQAAPGILASTLLAAAEGTVKSRPSSASSGLDNIDDLALHGGFRYGEVTSIAGASGSGKTLVGDLSTFFFSQYRKTRNESTSSFRATHRFGHF